MPQNSFDVFEIAPAPPAGNPAPTAEPPPRLRPRARLREFFKQLGTRTRSFLPILLGMVIAFTAMFAYDVLRPSAPRLSEQRVNELVASAMASATPPPSRGSLVYEQIAPALVRIEAQSTIGDDKRSLGTGVVVDETGAILSSYHIVKGAIKIEVIFYEGTRSDASIIAKDEDQDIVLLRARTPPALLVPAVLGNPGSLRVGDDVYAVGNPFGIRNSMSAGVVSGLNRNFKSPKTGSTLSNLIQFDAAANPGNSGGPLLNRDGEVVGIVTALYNPTEQEVFVGIAFAVPLDSAGGAMGSPPW